MKKKAHKKPPTDPNKAAKRVLDILIEKTEKPVKKKIKKKS